MTYKWLSFGQNHQEYQRFTCWSKYIKLFLPADQSSLVAVVPKNAFLVLWTRFYQANRAITSISQEEGIDIVCHHYEEHYQSKLPILTSYLGDLRGPAPKGPCTVRPTLFLNFLSNVEQTERYEIDIFFDLIYLFLEKDSIKQ